MLSAAVPILPQCAFMACAGTPSPSHGVKMKFPLFLKLKNRHLELQCEMHLTALNIFVFWQVDTFKMQCTFRH
jgi:hypothetical protein